MGEVWRARDTRLSREVAIKSLPEAFSRDAERLARFEREARMLASLQHPRIATIHGLEQCDGKSYLVMELVAGESLSERLGSGPIPIDEALEIARQIAEGLEAAHEKGIVHRDLKPANVQVGPDGSVKLLDFGLAKAFESPVSGASDSASRSPTISEQMTGTGIILGTAAYMSPEQARGRSVDRRSDLWSFGVLLFEVLSGRRLFTGETVSDTLAAVLRADPDWKLLPPETPAGIRRLLARCLERDPRQRLRDAGDARLEIEEAIAERRGGLPSGVAVVPQPAAAGPASRRVLPLAVAALAIAALAFLAGRWLSGPATSKTSASIPIHSVVNLPEGTFLAGWASPVVAISRDGRKLAFVATTSEEDVDHLYVHHLDRGETQVVPDSERAEGPFFSPDGQWVAFAVDVSLATGRPGQLKKFSLTTGLTQPIAPIPDYGGGDWGEDGTIVLTPSWSSGPWRVSADGGRPDTSLERLRLAGKDGLRSTAWPQWLPDGRSVLVVDADASAFGDAAVLDSQSRELFPTGVSAMYARYSPTGHLLTLQPDATIRAVPFDPAKPAGVAAGVAVLRDVAISAGGAPALALSENGSLVYGTGYLRASGRELLRLVRLSPTGAKEPLPFDPDTFGRAPRASPDGRRVALITWDGTVWVFDLTRGTKTRLPKGPTGYLEYVVWSPEGDWLAFSGSALGHAGVSLLRQRSDGSAPPEVLIPGGNEKAVTAFTPDGSSLIYRQLAEGEEGGIWLLPMPDGGKPRKLLAGRFRSATLSADGRFLAYDSAESGQFEVYVRRFPSLDGQVQVSVGGGSLPQWAPDGRAIHFVRSDRVYRVRFEPADDLRVLPPEPMFETAGMRAYSIDPAGPGFFALMRAPESGKVRQLRLVTNWFTELERLAPRGKGK
jgi:serine/threonine-protein kinase